MSTEKEIGGNRLEIVQLLAVHSMKYVQNQIQSQKNRKIRLFLETTHESSTIDNGLLKEALIAQIALERRCNIIFKKRVKR